MKTYEIMKAGIVISEMIPDSDYEDIFDLANEIYKSWLKEFKNLSFEEKGYFQKFVENYVKEKLNYS